MRPGFLIVPLAVAAGLVWLIASGADARLAHWAAGWQREFQNELARGLQALRVGQPGAVGAMIGLCFLYGVAHAVGPGHGKVLIGGYGVGRRVPVVRLSAIAIAASLGQALTAILVFGVGFLALGWTREASISVVEGIMAPISSIAIGLIGLWLIFRAGRRLWRFRVVGPVPHAHHYHADGQCDHCGHRHGPSFDEVEGVRSARDVAALILSIAIRPCSGALLLLVLTWHMGILAAGIGGTFAMSLGTGLVTVGVAIAAVTARESTFRSGASERILRRILPLMEGAAGMAIALVALRMLTG
ncbi:hypothetical protein MLD63_16440 [Paracoccus sp. TK19116]|uniref:Nickel/cobalt efflux system n=1 Tax=Paracoccus albicereus TaxID=2922394 RepID=A0ABT1MUJ8_9RHOB|nr:hypothetical protein [Paracoccus albicereus]MCQ0972013.1 hypothetical protein [Paracoccus albicereus]